MGKGMRLTPGPAGIGDGAATGTDAVPDGDRLEELVEKEPEVLEESEDVAAADVDAEPDGGTSDGPDAVAAGAGSEEPPGETHAPTSAPEASAGLPAARQRCPVCGAGGGEPCDDVGAAFARCDGCGTLFRRARPSLGQVARARDARFSHAFASPNHEERREARALAGEAMRSFFKLRSGKPAALNAFGKSVLDVNCGLGMRLRAFQSYGWNAIGTETSATAFEYARRQALDVRHGWLDDAGFGTARFDLVLFSGNLGELPGPRRAVARLRDVLAREGLVCVLREPLTDDAPEALADECRLSVYTAEAIRRLFCEDEYSFVSEEIEGGAGTFWFRAKGSRWR